MILITGATGFIGENLVKSLGKEKIRCLVRKNSYVESLKKDNIELLYGDLTDKDSVDKAVEGVDAVIHLAGELRSVRYETNYRINVLGTKNVVDACIKKDAKLVFTSSIMVTNKERGVYGETKLMAENIVNDAPIKKIILRPTMVYGAGRSTFMGVVDYVKKLPLIPVLGDGESAMQPVFIDDVVLAIKNSIKLKENGVFDLAGPSSFTFNEFIDMISDELGVERKKFHIPYKLSKFMAVFLSQFMERPPITLQQVLYLNQDENVDIISARRKLGFNPKNFKTNLKGIIKAV